jgi:hypothetical protein
VGPFPASLSSEPLPAQQAQQQRFAALLYAAVLQALPASARVWFADLRDRGTAAATERYTAAAVSGQLLAAELAAVTQVKRSSTHSSGQLDGWQALGGAISWRLLLDSYPFQFIVGQ